MNSESPIPGLVDDKSGCPWRLVSFVLYTYNIRIDNVETKSQKTGHCHRFMLDGVSPILRHQKVSYALLLYKEHELFFVSQGNASTPRAMNSK